MITKNSIKPSRPVSSYGKVAVVMGGTSAERDVSLSSGQAVLTALHSVGVDACGFDPRDEAIAELLARGVDRVFIALHGRGGEDGTIQGALQCLHIPYTGSGVLGSALCMDKIRSKQIFQAVGVATPRYRVVAQGEPLDLSACLAALGGVVIVKPALEGSSIGMAKANTEAELAQALELSFQHGQRVLIEEYIVGSEFTVSILGDQALPSIEVATPRVFYDYQAKYQADNTQYHCPSGLASEAEAAIRTMALTAFAAVNGSGWGRVDFMRSGTGELFVLEVNTVPGMTPKSLVPMAAKQVGFDFATMCLAILDSSFCARV